MRSKSLTLRRVRAGEPVPAWLAETTDAIGGRAGEPGLFARVAAGDAAYWILRAGGGREAVGAVAARLEADGALRWTWVGVAAPVRGWGLGGAAVTALERTAHRLGATSARARTPEANGIALYFWLRLGYRPLAAGPWPAECAGTWMVRETLRGGAGAGARGEGGG